MGNGDRRGTAALARHRVTIVPSSAERVALTSGTESAEVEELVDLFELFDVDDVAALADVFDTEIVDFAALNDLAEGTSELDTIFGEADHLTDLGLPDAAVLGQPGIALPPEALDADMVQAGVLEQWEDTGEGEDRFRTATDEGAGVEDGGESPGYPTESPADFPPTSGFESSEFGSDAVARSELTKNLPDNALDGVTAITYQEAPLPHEHPGALGHYNPVSGEITLINAHADTNAETLFHEAGHNYAHNNSQLVQQFQEARSTDPPIHVHGLDERAYHPNQLAEEHFCEAFKRYCLHPSSFRQRWPSMAALFDALAKRTT